MTEHTKSEHEYIFQVSGMHCQACVLLTESELAEQPGVSSVQADLSKGQVIVKGSFNKEPQALATEFNNTLSAHGYSVSCQKIQESPRWSDFKIALPAAIAFMALFLWLQKLGVVEAIGGQSVGYGTAFVVGIVASLSTCMAVVGGLVLSLSASFAQGGQRFRPQLFFHASRLISFALLGGVIGTIGSAFTLTPILTLIIGLVIAAVMAVLGLNLLEIFPWARRLQPRLPRFISRRALSLARWQHSVTPVVAGLITFFLPCGFTQSMQLYALSTGSFSGGALTMLFFALGTLPILALVSFSSLSIGKGVRAGTFFKTAGLIVIMFALLNAYTSLAAIGVLPPLQIF